MVRHITSNDSFFEFQVSKIKFVNILSIKETVLDVTLVGFVGSYSSEERAKAI